MRIRQSHLSLTSRILKLGLSLANSESCVATHPVVVDQKLRQAELESLVAHLVLRGLTRLSSSVPAENCEDKSAKQADEPGSDNNRNDFPRLPCGSGLREMLAVEIDFDVGSHVVEVIPCVL